MTAPAFRPASPSRDIPGIDLVKLLMAYCVVAIHAASYRIMASGWTCEWFPCLYNMAVPFFFMVTGWFTASSLEKTPGVSGRRALLMRFSRRRWLLYLRWTAVYLPVTALGWIFAWPGPRSLLRDVVTWCLSGTLGFGMFLWYVFSTAVVFMLMAFAVRFRRGFAVLAVFFVAVYLFGWVSVHVPGCYNYPGDILCTGTFIGGIYIFAGMALFRMRGRIASRIWLWSAAAMAVAAGLFRAGMPFTEFFGGAALLLAAVALPLRSSPGFLYLRGLSMWIYFTHALWMPVILALRAAFGYPSAAPCNFVIMALGSTAVSVTMMALSRKFPRLREML